MNPKKSPFSGRHPTGICREPRSAPETGLGKTVRQKRIKAFILGELGL